MVDTPLYRRVLWYLDNHGEQQMMTIESRDPAEIDRAARRFKAIEDDSEAIERSYRNGHTTFTDEEIDPYRVAVVPLSKDPDTTVPDHTNGFAWDANDEHHEFAYLIGEGLVNYAPGVWYDHTQNGGVKFDGPVETARYGNEVAKGGECWAGHEADKPLPLVAVCLACTKSGRDAAIPRPNSYDLKRRDELLPAWKPPAATKLPRPRKDRAGRELAGGCLGIR